MAMLDKPIIHFQLPHNENGEPTVEYEWVMSTPYDIDVIGAEVEKVKVDEITLKEFLKKHEIKDGADK